MPIEINRKTHVQWIPALSIAINVIDEITFIDPMEQYQQFTFKFFNDDTSTRIVHTIGLSGQLSDPASTDPVSAAVVVEVVDRVKVKVAQEQNWEYWYTFGDPGSLDSPGSDAPTPPKHLKTHVTAITYNLVDLPTPDGNPLLGDPTPSIIVAVERIDEFSVIDPMNQYQETIYKLDWENEIKNDQNLIIPPDQYELLTTSTDPKDFIVRLDPFQNVIGVNSRNYLIHTHWYMTGDPELSFGTYPAGPLTGQTEQYQVKFIRADFLAAGVRPSDFPLLAIPGNPNPGRTVFRLYPDFFAGAGYDYIVNLGGLFGGTYHNTPPPYLRAFDDDRENILPVGLWRVTFDQWAFLCDIYDSRTITEADRGSQYINHVGDTSSTAEAQLFPKNFPVGTFFLAGYARAISTITDEWYLQWVVVDVPS